MRGLWVVLLWSATAMAQTAVTATITDTDGTAWANGVWTASLYSPNGVPRVNGQPVPSPLSGVMDGTGTLTVTLTGNDLIAPTGSLWQFTLCPLASVSCSQVRIPIAGATQNASTALSAGVSAPRFSAGPYSYGYGDVEVNPVPLPGGTYYNVTSGKVRIWSGTAWSDASGSAGATIPATTNLISGDGAGNGANSGIAPANVGTLSGTQTFSGAKTFSGVTVAGDLRFNNAADTIDTVSGADVVIGRNFTPAADNAILIGNPNRRYLQVTSTRYATGSATNSDSAMQLTLPTSGGVTYTTTGSYLNHPICGAPSFLGAGSDAAVVTGYGFNWVGANGGTNTTPNSTSGTWTLTITPSPSPVAATPINLVCIARN